MSSRCRAIVCLGLVVALAGCQQGEQRAVVSGRLTEKGQAMTFQGADFQEGAAAVEVSFFRLGDDGKPVKGLAYNSRVKPDGVFQLDGPDGKGVPVGKYLVTLRRSGGTGPDPFEAKFSTAATPFKQVEVAAGKEIVLETSAKP